MSHLDKHYWTLGYVAADNECVPLFLSDVRKAILVCGKAVNLLKLCSQEVSASSLLLAFLKLVGCLTECNV